MCFARPPMPRTHDDFADFPSDLPSPLARSTRRALASILALLALVLPGCSSCEQGAPGPAAGPPRFVSLAPAITETLFAIGAGEQVVAVSQYCERPEEARRLPRVGTALTPNYEAIARLQPTLILTETNKSAKSDELKRLGPTLELPWLSLAEITSSIRALGERTGHTERANQLAERMDKELGEQPPSDAPKVLLVLGYAAKPSVDEVWFIRRNSAHGAALASAGGRNVVDRDIDGLPRLTVPQVLELDPDQIIVLVQTKRSEDTAILAAWNKLEPLSAVKNRRLAVLEAPEAFGNGPSILELRKKLKREIAALHATPGAASASPSREAVRPGTSP